MSRLYNLAVGWFFLDVHKFFCCVSQAVSGFGSYVALVLGDLPFIHSFQERWGCSLKHKEWDMCPKRTWRKVCCLWSLTFHVLCSRSHMASIGNKKEHGNPLQGTSSSLIRTMISRLHPLSFLAHQLQPRFCLQSFDIHCVLMTEMEKIKILCFKVHFSLTLQVSLPLPLTTHYEVSFKLFLE
jgi:hypothetical protein